MPHVLLDLGKCKRKQHIYIHETSNPCCFLCSVRTCYSLKRLSYFGMDVNRPTHHPSECAAVFDLLIFSPLLIGILLTFEHGAFKDRGSLIERQDRCEISQAFVVRKKCSALSRKLT